MLQSLQSSLTLYRTRGVFLSPAYPPRRPLGLAVQREPQRELGRLRHSVELVPTIKRADRGSVSRAESRATHDRQLPQPIYVIRRHSWSTAHITIQRVAR